MAAKLMLLLLCLIALELKTSFAVFEFDHSIDTDEYTLRSKGKFKRIIELNHETSVKRILCKGPVILVAMENVTIAETWEKGNIIIGGHEWGCEMRDWAKDPHVEYGFHRVIEEVKIKTDKRVDIYTTPAAMFDFFEEASIFYHHRQPSETNPESGKRKRRSIIPWKASNADVPVPDEVAATLMKNDEDDDWWSYNKTEAFFEARQTLNDINWHKEFTQSIGVNYDGHQAKGMFGIEDGEFVHDSTFFENMEPNPPKNRKSYGVYCQNCYAFYEPEVLFELEIDTLIGINKYKYQMSGDFVTNIDIEAISEKEVSTIFKKLFYSAPEHQWTSVSLVPEYNLYLTPKFQIQLDTEVDWKASGPGSMKVGYDQTGTLEITREWTPDGEVQNYSFTPTSVAGGHDLEVNMNGRVEYNISAMNTLISLKADIMWKFPKNIFGIYLTSPMQIRVEPVLVGGSVIGGDQVSCERAESHIGAAVVMDNVQYDAVVLGHKYHQPMFEDKMNNYFWMQKNHPVLDGHFCEVQCFGTDKTDPNLGINEACGGIDGPKGKEDMVKLVSGADIEFADEDSRHMSKTLAVMVTKMAQWVQREWDGRKLMVLSAWSPPGGHDDQPLHYEGRTAIVGVSAPLSHKAPVPNLDHSADLLSRLGQFAVCAGFSFVGAENSGHLRVGVVRDAEPSLDGQKQFENILDNPAEADLTFCDTYQEFFPEVPPGKMYPENYTSAGDMLGVDNSILRNNHRDFIHRLYQYKWDDVDFADDERNQSWCGTQSRPCDACDPTSNQAWSRCADRTMTPRLAAKLRTLAGLVDKKWPGDRIRVLEAWDEPTGAHPEGEHPPHSLHYEGRAACLSLPDPSKLAVLTSLALCAGFDMVQHPAASEGYITVFVQQQKGFFPTYVPFLHDQIMAVNEPLFAEHEYRYPPQLAHEAGPIELYDGSGDQANVYLGEYFQVYEFLPHQRQYFRLDPHLLECLQNARVYLRKRIDVVHGYKTQSINIADREKKLEREWYRFQSGQAADISLAGVAGLPERLLELGTAVIKACAVPIRMSQRVMGVGVHGDHLYVDVRRATVDTLDHYVELWSHDQKDPVFTELQRLQQLILTGGPPIVPHSWSTACAFPQFGYSMPHYQVQVRPSCRERSKDFCKNTKVHRDKWVAKIKEQMGPILGLGDHPIFLHNPDVEKCISTYCGSCNGAGATWRKKLEACANMLQSIKKHTYRELKRDKVAFFNTDNTESSVQGLACKGHVCLENTQVYSVFAPLIMSTYRLFEDKAQEERLYDGRTNPSPLIDLIEQGMAIRAEGDVHVFIDYERDISALKKVIKSVMVYNTKVTKVVFHLNETVFEDQLYEHIQEWMEVWRYDSCPTWSRHTIAPYEVRTIPPEQIVQSMKDGHDRNMMKRQIKNWELNWIMKL
jgi:hypothetical protein